VSEHVCAEREFNSLSIAARILFKSRGTICIIYILALLQKNLRQGDEILKIPKELISILAT
jgi:hypothetical protein